MFNIVELCRSFIFAYQFQHGVAIFGKTVNHFCSTSLVHLFHFYDYSLPFLISCREIKNHRIWTRIFVEQIIIQLEIELGYYNMNWRWIVVFILLEKYEKLTIKACFWNNHTYTYSLILNNNHKSFISIIKMKEPVEKENLPRLLYFIDRLLFLNINQLLASGIVDVERG